MLCIHHNDLDGRAAAAIVALKFPECRFVEADYRGFPVGAIGKDEPVFIVDYSPQPARLWNKIHELTRDVTWIDHHETAIENFNDSACLVILQGWEPKGLRSTERCGAWLTWACLFPELKIPAALHLIDAWDRWTHNDEPDVLNFVAGTKIRDLAPHSDIWNWLFLRFGNTSSAAEIIGKIQQDGSVVRSYEAIDNAENVRQLAYPVELDGYRCLACNSNRRNSKVFDSVHFADRPDVFIAYIHDGKKFTVSLYSETVKVNEIAKNHGGGGHPGAAGFICEALPWEKR